jgi:sentrin-specific protease 7
VSTCLLACRRVNPAKGIDCFAASEHTTTRSVRPHTHFATIHSHIPCLARSLAKRKRKRTSAGRPLQSHDERPGPANAQRYYLTTVEVRTLRNWIAGLDWNVNFRYDARMPPLPGKKWYNRISDLIPPMLGGHPGSDDSADSHAESRAHESQSEAAAGRASAGSGKRVRDSSEQLSPASKKQRTHSVEYDRLTGINTRVPQDRVVISIPGAHDRMNNETSAEAKKSQLNPVRTKPGSGYGHRTVNNIHANQPGRVDKVNPPVFKPAKAPVTAKPTRSTVRGTALNDGVGDSFSSPSKRRKTTGAPSTSNQHHLVELSDDDDIHVTSTVHAVNGRPISSNSTSAPIEVDSQSQSQSQISKKFFGAPEQLTVNGYVDSRPPRPRRRKSSGQKTPSDSSLVPNGSHPPAYSASDTRAQPTGIEDLARPSIPHMMKPSAKASAEKNNTLPHPSVTLGEGVDDFGPEDMQRRKDNHSLGRVNSKLNHISGRTIRSILENQRDVNEATEQKTQRQSRPTRVPDAGECEQPLRKLFARDTDSTPQQQQQQQQQQSRRNSLIRNMQVASNSGKHNAIQDSPDQLQGGNTMLSGRRVQQRPARTEAGSPVHRRSPSDLPPTNFTQSAQTSTRTVQPAQSAKKSDSNATRIPLEAVSSRGCVLDSRAMEDTDRIDLVYEIAHAAFIVELNGQPWCIPGSKELMTIGKHEASAWHGTKHSTQVMLKGSSSEIRSNGIILLSFVDEEGLRDCFEWLGVVSAETMSTKMESKERFEKIFQHQTVIVQLDAEKHTKQARTKSEISSMQAKVDTERHSKEQSATFEKIIYEQPNEGDRRQPSARSRMQDSVDQASSQLLPSPYFTGDGNRIQRKSTRQSKPVIERTPTPPPAPPRWTETHELEPWHQPVMYPPTGARRTAVDFQDIERLDEGEFLNDNLVGYALRRIEEDMAPEHKSKVHFFNSYFFTSLTSKNGRKAFNYDAVKKWTKQKDLFDTPYIVVPINENLHWFVAIICNLPNLVRKPALLDDDAADIAGTPVTSQRSSVQPSPIRDPEEEVPDSQELAKPDEQAMQLLSLGEPGKASAMGGDVFEFDEDDNVASSALESRLEGETASKTGRQAGKKSKKRAAPSLRKYPTDKPTIITLDSFGVGHPGQVSTLKKYVEAEAMDKRGMDAAGAGIQGMTAAGIPVQSNYCDCGLYLVGYVAEFAKDPEGFVNKVLKRQLDQENDFASFDPSEKRAEIRDDLLKLHAEQDQTRLALKKAKKEEKVKDKVAATAVTATPAASARSSPARAPAPPHPAGKQSVKAPSSPGAVSPTASRISSEELGHPRDAVGTSRESRLDPKVNATERLTRETRAIGDSSDDDALDEEPPKPLLAGTATGLSVGRAQTSVSRQEVPAAGSSAQGGDDCEMLFDGTMDSKEEKMREYAQRRNGHKVTSPGLEDLANILKNGYDSAPSLSQGKSPAKNAL